MSTIQIPFGFFSLVTFSSVLLLGLETAQAQEKKIIRPGASGQAAGQSAAAKPGVISPGVLVGDVLYLAGQGSRDPKTGQHPEGFEAQVKQAMENPGAVLKAADLDFSHVVNANVYLTDIKNFSRMNRLSEHFKPIRARPSRFRAAAIARRDHFHCVAKRRKDPPKVRTRTRRTQGHGRRGVLSFRSRQCHPKTGNWSRLIEAHETTGELRRS